MADRDRIRELRARGWMLREIAEAEGCTYQYVQKVLRAAGRPRVDVARVRDAVVVTSADLPPDALAEAVRAALGRSRLVDVAE